MNKLWSGLMKNKYSERKESQDNTENENIIKMIYEERKIDGRYDATRTPISLKYLTNELMEKNNTICYIKDGKLISEVYYYGEIERPSVMIGDIFHRFMGFNSYEVLCNQLNNDEKYIKRYIYHLDDFNIVEQAYIYTRIISFDSFPTHTNNCFFTDFSNLLIASSNPDIKRMLVPNANQWLEKEMKHFPIPTQYEPSHNYDRMTQAKI